MDHWVAGVDEVGRGPLAGPVVAAAVILDPMSPIEGINDSKRLTALRRDILFDQIVAKSIAYAVGRAEVDEIDRINILQASLLAMQRAVEALPIQPSRLLVDGNRCPTVTMPAEAIIRGDQSELCIAAASIIAKVTRDREMCQYEKEYPGYGFMQHKGYGTKAHYAALQRLGATPIHRRSFRLGIEETV